MSYPTFPFIAKSTVCQKKIKKVNNNNELGRKGDPSPSTKGRIQSPPPFVNAVVFACMISTSVFFFEFIGRGGVRQMLTKADNSRRRGQANADYC